MMRQMLLSLIGAIGVVLMVGSPAGAVSISIDTDPGTAGIQNSINVLPGQNFAVDVVASNIMAPGLNGFQFDLNFDGSILAPTSVVDGGFLLNPFIVVNQQLNAMTVSFAEVTLLPFGAIGTGTLATVTFSTLSAGTTPLTLNNAIFSAPFGVPITIDNQNNAGVNAVPEPTTFLLLGTGLAGLAGWRYRKSVKA